MTDSIAWPGSMWVVGCGNMGGAILQAWLDQGAPLQNITVIDPNPSRLPEGMTAQSEFPNASVPDLVLLSVKPQMLGEVASKLAPVLDENSKLVSILAGTDLSKLRQNFPAAGAIIRLMPNMAVTLGKSPMIMFSDDRSDALRSEINALFYPLGQPEWLDNEDLMHLSTALSGSGPAFVFRFIDALGASAVELGMAKDQAARLALAMVEGAAMLAAASEDSPGALAERVASPGGTTRAGLDVLDEDNRLNELIHSVLKAALDRSQEMAEDAKS